MERERAAVLEWISAQLGALLGFENRLDALEMAQYMVTFPGHEEAELYLTELIGDGNPGQLQLLAKDAMRRWRQPSKSKRKKKGARAAPPGMQPAKVVTAAAPQEKQKQQQQQQTHKKQTQTRTQQQQPAASKGKPHYVNLLSKVGQSRLAERIPGRHPCDCMAARHKLVNNCLRCGKIVCEQEGIGPCVSCGALVVRPEQQEMLARRSKKSTKFLEALLKELAPGANPEEMLQSALPGAEESYEVAMERRDRLVEYDRTSASRSKVYDDSSDYFATDTNSWLSEKEREAVRAKEAAARHKREAQLKSRKITLDFAGRTVTLSKGAGEPEDMYAAPDDVDFPETAALKSQIAEERERAGLANDNPFLKPDVKAPTFVGVSTGRERAPLRDIKASAVSKRDRAKVRLQDTRLAELTDEGKCMAMHQPWASLLTRGIKIHEGRSWYTAHRGRLWISAGTKEYEEDEFKAVVQLHEGVLGDGINYPEEYPRSCLLGCVDVVDCLSQEEYRSKFPNGMSQMPYVFICENPQELIVRFPMKSQHKIFKLEREIHLAAKSGAQLSDSGIRFDPRLSGAAKAPDP